VVWQELIGCMCKKSRLQCEMGDAWVVGQKGLAKVVECHIDRGQVVVSIDDTIDGHRLGASKAIGEESHIAAWFLQESTLGEDTDHPILTINSALALIKGRLDLDLEAQAIGSEWAFQISVVSPIQGEPLGKDIRFVPIPESKPKCHFEILWSLH